MMKVGKGARRHMVVMRAVEGSVEAESPGGPSTEEREGQGGGGGKKGAKKLKAKGKQKKGKEDDIQPTTARQCIGLCLPPDAAEQIIEVLTMG